MPPTNGQEPKLILLVHGIRTLAFWQDRIAKDFSNDNNAVLSIGYGFFNIFEFLSPVFTRQHAVNRVRLCIEKAISDYPNHELIIIAHSFGTYCVTKILDDSPLIKPKRIIFCGSVVDTNFKWYKLPQAPFVLNECGTKDIWPCFARSATWGFGNSGTFGFKTPGVRDRYHANAHSDYFKDEFYKKYWQPFIKDGEIIPSDAGVTQSEPSWFMSLLAFRLFGIPHLGVLAGILFGFLTFNILSYELNNKDKTSKANSDSSELTLIQKLKYDQHVKDVEDNPLIFKLIKDSNQPKNIVLQFFYNVKELVESKPPSSGEISNDNVLGDRGSTPPAAEKSATTTSSATGE